MAARWIAVICWFTWAIWWMAIYGHSIGSCMVNITCSSKGMSWTSSMWLTKCKSSACKCSKTRTANLPVAAMPKIVVTRHHEFSSIIMDQIVLVTFISEYHSNNLVHQLRSGNTSLFWKLCLERHSKRTQLFTTWIDIKILFTWYEDFIKWKILLSCFYRHNRVPWPRKDYTPNH